MRKPTPVTTRIITEESGSSWKAAGAEKPPAVTHGKRTWTKKRAGALGEDCDRAVHDSPQEGERGDEPEVVEDFAYHLSTLSSVTSTVSFRRKLAIRIARPPARLSAAA